MNITKEELFEILKEHLTIVVEDDRDYGQTTTTVRVSIFFDNKEIDSSSCTLYHQHED
jgi:hypothetical protein